MTEYVYCQVVTVDDNIFNVSTKHYEQLRDLLDRGDKGWIELETVTDPDTKVMVKLSTLAHIILVTAQFERERNLAAITNL